MANGDTQGWGWRSPAWLLLPLLAGWGAPGCRTTGPPPSVSTPDGVEAEDAAYWLKAGRQLEQEGLDVQAVKLYRSGLGRVRDPGSLLEHAATVAWRLDDPTLVIGWLQQLVQAQPTRIELQLRLAVAEARQGATATSRARVLEWLAQGRCPVPQGHLALAWVEWYGGQLPRSQVLARLARGKKQPGAGELLARILVRQGRLDEAERELETAWREEPDRPELLLLQAEVQLQGGRADRASRTLKQFLEKRPWHPRGLLLAGLSAIELGERDAARGFFDQALQVGEAAAREPLTVLRRPGGPP